MGNREKQLGELIRLLTAAVILTAAFFAGRQAAVLTGAQGSGFGSAAAEELGRRKYCVVVDAGHGGDDPGKIGVNGSLEKDINLAIARRLAVLLEQADVKVVLTRKDENGLYDAGASRKKVQDMKRRIAVMEEADPDLVVSIHQNSYPDASVRGAQVFYYTDSPEGRILAEKIQERLVTGLDPENRRTVKANNSYYLLKKTTRPTVIVECGFLSCPEEEALLSDPDYQERTAWQIHMGILRYLK
ncbi:MAG: N-acetylmuramoyl-L-alanine amidase [Eubacteriales bacterium]|nr:N-acetylmuramoyl-L-alanine amidase [Eubacteriales bacterium]